MKKDKYIGDHHGELVVVMFIRKVVGGSVYKCRCSCGNVKEYYLGNLRSGKSRSCGCKKSKHISEKVRIHGGRHTRLYSIWTNMKTRCSNPNSPNYQTYGAKGIKVCSEWDRSFVKFEKWALQNGYEENLSLDRIDNSKGYNPLNCRWANDKTQSRNRKYAWFIEIDGITKHAKEWCLKYGVNYKTAHNRFKKLGWTAQDAVTKKQLWRKIQHE